MVLPSASLLPNSTVIIPIATLLGPFDHFDFPEWSQIADRLPDDQMQQLIHTSLSETRSNANVFGPTIWPSGVRFRFEGIDYIQNVHELDLSNLYALNRYWEMGSCPYLFFRNSRTQKLIYSSQLFANSPYESRTETKLVPDDACEIVIAELEQEETFLEEIYNDGVKVLENIHLTEGDILTVKVQEGTIVVMKGYYVPQAKTVPRFLDPWRKNELIGRFLYHADTSPKNWTREMLVFPAL